MPHSTDNSVAEDAAARAFHQLPTPVPTGQRHGTSADWTKEVTSLQQLLDPSFCLSLSATAIEFPEASSGERNSITFAELHEFSNKLARHLIAGGVRHDSIVGICIDRSIEMIVAMMAVTKAGGAYLPLDPTYPIDRLTLVVEEAQATIILASTKTESHLPAHHGKNILIDADWDRIAGQPGNELPRLANGDSLAYVIYTSGSTGRPKGVAMRHEPLVNLLQWQRRNSFTPADARTLQFTSINFDVSFQEIYSTLTSGGTLVLIREQTRKDPNEIVRFLERHKIDRLFLPFVALKHLAEAAGRLKMYPGTLREVITAGEQLQITPSIREFFAHLPDAILSNQYGPSETHVVTALVLGNDSREWPDLPSIGIPISEVSIHLLDDQKKPVKKGDAGELYIAGRCLARGYLNQPVLTDERFVTLDIDGTSQRLYKTGDLARMDAAGNIEFLGRLDHQVKIRGFRIELGEIEALLLQHPNIREAVVVAREWKGEKQLVAYFVPQLGMQIDSRTLRDYLQAKLPPYAVPAVFALLQELPVTSNGKVDRKALPDPIFSSAENRPVILPETPLEMRIKLVFERFFNVRPISTDTSFFELGGDSLQALQLITELETTLQEKLSLGVLYEASTIEQLAKKICDGSAEGGNCSLVPLQPLGAKRPIFLIHTTPGDVLGYGNLVYHLGTSQPCYGLQSMGLIDPDARHTRVDQMADHYLREIRKVQPRGPYFLAGWCYGGIVAVEMAHKLLAAGERVDFLGLIETPAPKPSGRRIPYYARRIFCLLTMAPRQWGKYIRAKQEYYRGVRTENEKRFKRATQDEVVDQGALTTRNRYLDKLETVYHTNLDAIYDYKTRFYPGEIVLFNAAEPDPAVLKDDYYGWWGLAKAVRIHEVPGNHDTILMEPHVGELARELTGEVDSRS